MLNLVGVSQTKPMQDVFTTKVLKVDYVLGFIWQPLLPWQHFGVLKILISLEHFGVLKILISLELKSVHEFSPNVPSHSWFHHFLLLLFIGAPWLVGPKPRRVNEQEVVRRQEMGMRRRKTSLMKN